MAYFNVDDYRLTVAECNMLNRVLEAVAAHHEADAGDSKWISDAIYKNWYAGITEAELTVRTLQAVGF